MMNTSKLTQKSLEVVQEAQSIAIRNSNQQIEQPHLLLALLADENGLIPELLVKMGIDASAVRDRAEDCVNALPKVTGSGRDPEKVYVSSDTDKALSAAEDAAKHMGDEYISVEHLFLGLIDKCREKTADIIKLFGITRGKFLDRPRQYPRNDGQPREHLRRTEKVWSGSCRARAAEQA